MLIGVDRVGDLPVLQDAAAGARRMEEWARGQEMSPIEVFTDEGGEPVEIADVKKAIRKIVEVGTTEQLVVYFAGHGVNINYGEYWLLSDAPGDTNAAVNVAGSSLLARIIGLPYVVFVSDACRTAADGIQAQRVTGSEIFPNDPAGGPEDPVDQFYACLLGSVANEVRDPATTAKNYTALYTAALLDVLGGKRPDVLDWTEEESKQIGYVRPRPLKRYLHDEVTRRLKQLGLETQVIQVPDAHIASDETAWISRCAAGDVPANGDRTRSVNGSGPPPRTPLTVATSLLEPALGEDLRALDFALEVARSDEAPQTSAIAGWVVHGRELVASGIDIGSGFKVRGARFAEAFSPVVPTELLDAGSLVRADPQWPGASVLLTFPGGTGALLPAIPDFVATLTVDAGELVDVAYEPSEGSWRWEEFSRRAPELRALRAVAAASARNGVFRLDGTDAETVARRMQSSKGVDPTLAVYAAYAYQDLGLSERIRNMSEYMGRDLGAVLFDVALLARRLDGQNTGMTTDVLPLFPLLSQGWGLLQALRVTTVPPLATLRQTLVPSLWTMFDARGVEHVRLALLAGARG